MHLAYQITRLVMSTRKSLRTKREQPLSRCVGQKYPTTRYRRVDVMTVGSNPAASLGESLVGASRSGKVGELKGKTPFI